MIRKITLLLFTVIFIVSARAGFTPVALTGFNKDVVANGVGPVRSSTNSSVDDAKDTSGFAFLTFDYKALAGDAAPTYALPQNGIINSVATAGNSYQLAAYSGNNSLRLATQGATGTLTFGTQYTASDVYVLATSGSGAATGTTISVNFSDNTSQLFTVSINDWYDNTGFAIQGIGRVNLTTGVPDIGGGTGNPRLYETRLTLSAANYSKSITGITVTKTNATGNTFGYAQIMAVSVNTIGACAAPANAPTNLVLTPTIYGVSGSFTGSVPASDKYMVLRTPGPSPADTPPTDGVVYTVGQVLGNSTIISLSTGTTFTDPNLTINATYTYLVVGYSDGNCYGISPAYNIVNPLFGSTTIPPCSSTAGGTISVGPTGAYPTLTAAMTALNNAAGASGNIIVELQPSYTSAGETFPILVPNISTSPCAVNSPTLTIRPALDASNLVITGSNAMAILDFNNAQKVTLDGRPGGVGTSIQLSVINTNTAGVAIRLYNDASFNTITYCDIQGQNTSAASNALSGVLYIGAANAATLRGNDNNTITFNSIHGTASGTPAMGIVAYGSTPTKARYNDSCTIANNRIYDFFNAGVATTGIKVDIGNNAWTINNNSLYQTTTRTYTSAVTHRALWITPNVSAVDSTAGNFTITNNFIGGSAASAGGTAYTMNGAVASVFMGMDLSLGNGLASSIQNNTIANMSLTSTGTSTTTGVFVGIGTANGVLNIGTLVGNTIGSTTVPGSITLVSASAGTSYGIRVAGGSTVNVTGNTITGITGSGTTGVVSTNFTGIAVTAGVTVNLTNNTIGSGTVANSISLTSTGSATAQSLVGIAVTGGTATTITNNTVANLTNGYTSTGAGGTRGITVTSSASSITGNTIRNLSCATLSTSGGATSALNGIVMTSTNTSGCNIIGNTIHSLISTAVTGSATLNFTGIFYSGTASSTSYILKNQIHSFDAPADTNITFTGIDFATATAIVANNFIRLGVKPDGTAYATSTVNRGISSNSSTALNSFLFNSIYIGGTTPGASIKPTYAFIRTSNSGTYDIRSNIFVNARSNAAAGGKHYALFFTTATTGAAVNFNVYNTSGTGGVFANNGTADVANYTAGWLTGDANSTSGNPGFIAPDGTSATFNLHINAAAPSIAESAGSPSAFVQDDIDNTTRNATLPDAGADEFIGVNPNICTGTPTPGTISSTATLVCAGVNFTLSITGASGNPGISYQWQSSPDSITWTNISGAINNTYSGTQSVKTYYRVAVKCSNSALTANSPGLAIANILPTYAVYDGTAYVESFESWVNSCNTTDLPGVSWRNGVPTGNNAWRRFDQGASAGWTSTSGAYAPTFTTGAFSARFHSFNTPAATSGYLDFYVNMSAAGSSTNIKFDYINTTGTDSLSVLISTNGGTTFTRLDSVGIRSGWSTKTVNITSASATTVIRLLATSDNGGTDIGIDNFQLLNFAQCSGTPLAGTTTSSSASVCNTVSFTLSSPGLSQFAGITYQWQSSPDNTTWTNIAGATAIGYTTTQTANTYYRIVVNCINSGLSASSAGLLVSTISPVYAVYNGISYTESFESWVNSCSTTDLPGTSWRNAPITGNNSWRRHDQQASAAWVNPTLGLYAPAFTTGAFSARFHSYQAAVGDQGMLDFYVNMSAASSSTNLKFNYINTSGTDTLSVLISTNGGATFTRIDSVGIRGSWATKTINITSTSATTVIRLMATSDFGTTDIGVDNFQLVDFSQCTGSPFAGTVTGTATSVCSGTSFTLTDAGASQTAGVSYQWQSSVDNTTWVNIAGATTLSLSTSQTVVTYYRLVVTCTPSATSSATPGVLISLNSPTTCYCTPTYLNGGGGDFMTSVAIGGFVQATAANTAPYYINYTGSQSQIPQLAKGVTDTLRITFSTDGTQYSGAWIDLNQDGTFATTEYFSTGTNAGASGSVKIPIAILPTATLGITGMRVRGGEDVTLTSAQACGASSSPYGQAQDYFVRIVDVITPITLLDFKGERKASNNLLSWTTGTEQNSAGFELERSADGINFSSLGYTASKAVNGNSSINISYSFTDLKVLKGNNYYRLKQIDKDGQFSYSRVVLLKGDKVNALSLSVVYPNPAINKLNVIIASPKDNKISLIITDVAGKIVSRKDAVALTGDNKYELNIQTLASGNYVIKAICEEGCETVISKFVKQ